MVLGSVGHRQGGGPSVMGLGSLAHGAGVLQSQTGLGSLGHRQGWGPSVTDRDGVLGHGVGVPRSQTGLGSSVTVLGSLGHRAGVCRSQAVLRG